MTLLIKGLAVRTWGGAKEGGVSRGGILFIDKKNSNIAIGGVNCLNSPVSGFK